MGLFDIPVGDHDGAGIARGAPTSLSPESYVNIQDDYKTLGVVMAFLVSIIVIGIIMAILCSNKDDYSTPKQANRVVPVPTNQQVIVAIQPEIELGDEINIEL